MIREDYVSFETAKLLKEKGFTEKSYEYYTKEGLRHCEKLINNAIIDDGFPSEALSIAPTHQMVLKWLREVHQLIITIDYDRYECVDDTSMVGYGYNIQTKDNPEDYYQLSESVYDTYEEAVETAIEYCFKLK